MRVRHGLEALPLEAGPTVATIGFFDGVHRGHQAVMRRTVDAAGDRAGRAVVVTFDRHPREVLTPGQEPKLLTSLDRKAAQLEALGIDDLVVLEFTEDFSRWPPDAFADRVLVDGLRAEHVVVGSNFTFGYRALGTLPVLSDLGAGRGFSVEGVAVLRVGGRPVSSSSIREALAAGDLAWPTEALGRRYVVDGRVGAGAGRGRDLGFPTANLEVPSRILLPGDGVYAGRAHVDGEAMVAAINVGTNPTFGGEPLHVEAHLLDFDGVLTGKEMAVEFWTRLRDETRFESAAALVRQIAEDVARTRALVT
jgi:riboflavin kinase/FMN adenylyltransferase